MIDNKLVGLSIAHLRQSRGMTQQALAACMNVSHQAVSKWENGSALPDVLTLVSISKFFGVTMEQLLNGDVSERISEANADKKIELKLDPQPLSERVREALDDAEKAVEEDSAEEKPAEATEENDENENTVPIDIDELIRMAPFMSRQALDKLAVAISGKCTPQQLSKLAPFVSSETLEKLIIDSNGELSWDMLRRLAPFLKKEIVDSLTLAVAKGEKYYRPTAKAIQKSADHFGRYLSKGIDKLARKMESIGGHFDVNFVPASKPEGAPKTGAASARSRIFSRALAENKFDWIAEHLDQLDDDELREKIAAKALELGMTDWLKEHMSDALDNEAMDKAILEGDWEHITENLDDADAETMCLIAVNAAKSGKWDWLKEHLGDLELESGTFETIITLAADSAQWDWLKDCVSDIEPCAAAPDVAAKAYKAGRADVAVAFAEQFGDDYNFSELFNAVLENDDADTLGILAAEAPEENISALCLNLAKEGKLSLAMKLADKVNEETLAALVDIAADTDDWDAMEKLNDLL